MTKLEELKAAYDAAYAAYRDAACDDTWDAADGDGNAYVATRDAYEAELKKTQEEKQND
jgi:hypothetical protein